MSNPARAGTKEIIVSLGALHGNAKALGIDSPLPFNGRNLAGHFRSLAQRSFATTALTVMGSTVLIG